MKEFEGKRVLITGSAKAIMYRRWSKITRKAVEKGLLVK